MTLRQKLACVGLAVFGLQIASAAAGGAPLRDRLQRWFDPEQLLLASVRMELGAPPVAVSPTPEAAAALSAASPAPEVTPVPTADDDVENAPTATADGLPIVATSIAGGLTVKNETDIPVSVAALLQQGPATVLPAGEPQILIMHTHATEDYRLSAGLWFAPGDGARSTDCSMNMCAVGRVVADTLNAAGINTLHDETLNDYPSYTGSYANSRAVVQQYLGRYPSIKVVLDVHRDAIETESGSRYAPVCTVDGRQAAQVMIICGCDNGTTVQLPGWRQNLRFAAAWERSMEGMYPGFTRPVLFSYRFYNQDLTTGSLLIEIGGHGNNLNEALYAGQLAAKGLAAALLGGA